MFKILAALLILGQLLPGQMPTEGPSEISIVGTNLDSIDVGARVYVNDQIVGKITAVDLSGPNSLTLSAAIEPSYRSFIRKGTFGRAFIEISKESVSTNTAIANAAIELVCTPSGDEMLLEDGAVIETITSFEDYWKHGL